MDPPVSWALHGREAFCLNRVEMFLFNIFLPVLRFTWDLKQCCLDAWQTSDKYECFCICSSKLSWAYSKYNCNIKQLQFLISSMFWKSFMFCGSDTAWKVLHATLKSLLWYRADFPICMVQGGAAGVIPSTSATPSSFRVDSLRFSAINARTMLQHVLGRENWDSLIRQHTCPGNLRRDRTHRGVACLFVLFLGCAVSLLSPSRGVLLIFSLEYLTSIVQQCK